VFRSVSREERLVQTEKLFKRLNASLTSLLSDGSGSFFCDCGNPLCSETIELTTEDPQLLHSLAGYVAILPGYEIPDTEQIVLARPQFSIVKKH